MSTFRERGVGMSNIPTDKLRSLVALADLRSFTLAAQSLGTTQPNISVHIRQLQQMFGCQLLDKSAPGIRLTPRGEMVVSKARRFFSVHDSMLHMTRRHEPGESIRLGVPSYYAGRRVPATLIKFRQHRPGIKYRVTNGPVDEMLRNLEAGELDLALAIIQRQPNHLARHIWAEELVWVHSSATKLDPEAPVPIVSYGSESACHRAAIDTLDQAGLAYGCVLTSSDISILRAGVEAGFGVMPLPRKRAIRNQLMIWDNSPLPELPQVYVAILVRGGGGNRNAIEELADYLNDEIPAEPVSGPSPVRAKELC
jgi:DNA-binding transcriptional LysR family regulator